MSVKHGLICENKCMVEGVTKEEFDAKVSGSMDDIIIRSTLASGVKLKTDFTYHFRDRTETELPYVETILGTNFSSMFYNCGSLTKVQQPLGILDTRQGTNFMTMFYKCSALQTIPEFDTSQGTNFGGMFNNCSALQTIPALDTSQGTDFSYMFNNCSALQTIPALDTSQGTNFEGMFYGCNALQTIPALDTSQGTNFSLMFRACTALQTIPALDTSQGTNFASMFNKCSALTTFTENPLLGDTVPWQFGADIDFSSCPLDKASILQVFNGLKTVSGKTITISSTTNGYLTELDKIIAISKGWTVKVA